MKVITAVIAATIYSISLPGMTRAQSGPDMAIEHVTVIPMDSDRRLIDYTVVISGSRIVQVAPSTSVTLPEGTTVVSGEGRFLMPGLAEMHGHLPSAQWSDEMVDRLLFLNVANGVTTVRGMQGNDAQLRLRSEIQSGQRLGPRLILGSPALTGDLATSPAVGARLVREYYEAGYDLLKVHEGLSRETFDSIAIVAREVGIPFGGHIAEAVGLQHSVDLGIGTVEHLDGFIEQLQPGAPPARPAGFFGLNWASTVDRSAIDALVETLDRNNVWVTPTQSLFVSFLSERSPQDIVADPIHGMNYWPAETVDRWITRVSDFRASLNRSDAEAMMETRSAILESIQRTGGKILLGADSPQIFNVPGFATVYEAQVMVEAGLTPYEALKAATVNPAAYLGQADKFGVIRTGMRADLLLLEADPIDDITNLRNVAGVVVNGRWLPEAEIRTGLAELER